MIPTALTDDEIEAFHRDGFVIRRSLFTAAEASLMSQALAQDTAIQDRAYGLEDGHGGATVVAVWNQPSEAAVRRIVAELNVRIAKANSETTSGPASDLGLIPSDGVVAEWKKRRKK